MKKITIDGHHLSYRSQGIGPVLLLLHGFAESHAIWESQIERFAEKGMRVLAPDLPGFGASDTWMDISIPKMAQLVQQIVAHEHIQQYIVLGHSMGGYIALSLAQQFPHSISGLGLIHSHPFADSEERKQGRRKSIDFIREHGKTNYLKQLFPGFFPPGYAQNHPQIVHKLLEISHAFSEEGICAALEAMAMREDMSHVLVEFPNPVLFILGKEDMLVPITDMMRTQTTLPKNPVVHILEGVGHMSMFEAPEQLAQILEQYVEQIITHNT